MSFHFLGNRTKRQRDAFRRTINIEKGNPTAGVAICEGGVVKSVVDHHVREIRATRGTVSLAVHAKPLTHATPNVLVNGGPRCRFDDAAALAARPFHLELGSFLWNLYAFYEGFGLYV